jgi:predicted PurR-regulated permease PerM
VAPLILAFILTYLLYPVADWLRVRTHISWRVVVSVIYLLLILALAGLLTWGGFALLEQTQSLIRFLQRAINSLPEYIAQLSTMNFQLGPFQFGLAELDLDINTISEQVFGAVQPILSGAGTLVGSFASGTASTIGWVLFVIVVSYFMLAETEGIPGRIINLKVPGYQQDFERLGRELANIWNAFLRGQIVLIVLTVVVYSLMLGIMGVRFYIGLALLAGMARLVPYIGPAVAWTAYGLVAFFQVNPYNMPTLGFVIMVIGAAWLVDVIIDSLVTPRVLADALQIHPAAVLMAALIAVSLLGVMGIILAAPVLATLLLLVRYAIRKLMDLDPWVDVRTAPPPPPISDYFAPVVKIGQRTWTWAQQRFGKAGERPPNGSSQEANDQEKDRISTIVEDD